VRAAAGALLFGGAHALVHRVAPGSLGAGDVKLSGSLGAVLGAAGWSALASAAVLAALLSLVVALVRKGGRVPHGPALLTATWLCTLFPGPP
jgi:leader peptidase (prepilin peptidase)/N-methyltransferase